jgi:predicted RNase H-like nuclease
MPEQNTVGKDGGRWLAGVDGCRAGWVVALATEREEAPPRLEICATFRGVLELVGDSGIVVIDMPIGLLDEPHPGGRECDIVARKRLGPRRSSISSPPARSALSETGWEQARRCGLTRQGFAILPKIREVDALMTSALQERVFESHPELAFCALAGRPMEHGKKRHAGRVERRNALSRAADAGFGGLLVDLAGELEAAKRQFARKQVGIDDILDAYVMLWVAARIARGEASAVPTNPPVDRCGLRMEMWV